MNDDKAALHDFNGVARLFPLPNLVFFPHALQPLHIFEPRYRQMTADALTGDRLIALVLLQPGWDKEDEEKPTIHSVGCLGRIVADNMLDDGRYNLLLRGLGRVRILEEVPGAQPYRSARVELAPDSCTAPLELLMERRRQIKDKILARFSNSPIAKQLDDLFHSELPLGTLCDVLAFALPLATEWKQLMLEEPREDIRADMLLEGFERLASGDEAPAGKPNRKFPPDFSEN
jgi:uncharacterized protein